MRSEHPANADARADRGLGWMAGPACVAPLPPQAPLPPEGVEEVRRALAAIGAL